MKSWVGLRRENYNTEARLLNPYQLPWVTGKASYIECLIAVGNPQEDLNKLWLWK